MSPFTSIKSSMPMRAQSFIPPPFAAPTLRALSKNSHTKSPFFIRHTPPGAFLPSKKTKGRQKSVCLTASWICAYSLRSFSFSTASRASAVFVKAFGWNDTALLGLSRFLRITSGASSASTDVSCGGGMLSLEGAAGTLSLLSRPSASSSSSPKDNPPFLAIFFLFLNAAGLPVDSLYLGRQHPRKHESFSCSYRPSGVVAPLALGVPSRDSCSSASARLFLKSDS